MLLTRVITHANGMGDDIIGVKKSLPGYQNIIRNRVFCASEAPALPGITIGQEVGVVKYSICICIRYYAPLTVTIHDFLQGISIICVLNASLINTFNQVF